MAYLLQSAKQFIIVLLPKAKNSNFIAAKYCLPRSFSFLAFSANLEATSEERNRLKSKEFLNVLKGSEQSIKVYADLILVHK